MEREKWRESEKWREGENRGRKIERELYLHTYSGIVNALIKHSYSEYDLK